MTTASKNNNKKTVGTGNTKYTSFVYVHKKYFPTEQEIRTQEESDKPIKDQHARTDADIFDRVLSYQDQ